MANENNFNEYEVLIGAKAVGSRLRELLMEMPTGIDYSCDAPEDLDDMNIVDAKMWAVAGKYHTPCERAISKLPSGQFRIGYSQDKGIYLFQRDVKIDELLVLPDSKSEEVIAAIEVFWSREAKYREFKFLWKRGVLLYGPPGSGKTSTVQIISQRILARGGLTIFLDNPQMAVQGLEILRIIEPTRPIVCILEDIDAIIKNYGESELLALLDGEFQIDNVTFIATTNYPELLDKRLTNRPSRFDFRCEIGMPNAAAREMFLRAKNPRFTTCAKGDDSYSDMSYWISKTEGYSVAHLKELIVSVECLGLEVDDSLKRLREMINEEVSSADIGKGKFGFTNDEYDD